MVGSSTLGQKRSVAEGVKDWDSESWNFIAKCDCHWSLLLWPLLIPDTPNLHQMSQEVLSDFTCHLLIPSPRGTGNSLDCRFILLLVNSSEPVFPRADLSKALFSCPLTVGQRCETFTGSTLAPEEFFSGN